MTIASWDVFVLDGKLIKQSIKDNLWILLIGYAAFKVHLIFYFLIWSTGNSLRKTLQIIDDDWKEITEFIEGYSIQARKDAYIGGVPFISRYWKECKRHRNPKFVVTPLRDVLAFNNKCKPDSFVSFLYEKERQNDGVRFGRAVYFFRLCLTSGLQHHPFAFN